MGYILPARTFCDVIVIDQSHFSDIIGKTTERERERGRERQRGRETERQRDRETDKQTYRV